ncbi:MAG: phosphatase PAP2 family protein [Bacteroidota bacterium]
MTLIKEILAGSCALLALHPVFAQTNDTTKVEAVRQFSIRQPSPVDNKPFPVKSFIIPALAIGYGFSTLENHNLKHLNREVKEEVWTETPHAKTKLDNYLQWSPAIAVYGLNAAGIHGRNNLRDRSMIFLMSEVFMNAAVFPLKKLAHQQRPDGSDYYSFPSGHTANAFAGAEFMWQEYKDVSPWLAASGYLVAATTGYLRMYNNKHWLNDVVAGAGVGIASTKLAYWLYPKFQHKLFKDKMPNTMIMPVYQNKSFGLGLVKQF